MSAKWHLQILLSNARRFYSSMGNPLGLKGLKPVWVHSQVIPCGFFCCCRHIIAWNMWTEDKLDKKYVVAEIFAELVSKGIKAILLTFVYFMNAWHDRMLHATSDLAD